MSTNHEEDLGKTIDKEFPRLYRQVKKNNDSTPKTAKEQHEGEEVLVGSINLKDLQKNYQKFANNRKISKI